MTREAIRYKLNELRMMLNDGEHTEEQGILVDIIKELDKAESDNKWIPVSERLPEDHKDVLICLSSDQICIGCYNSHKLPFSNNVIGWGASYTHNWCSNDVIAWQPLPEPYKENDTWT